MTSTRPLAALAAASLLAGCHMRLPGGAACPSRGGRQWREYRSRHFVVDTDLDRPAAAALIAQLETLQARIVIALTGEAREMPGYVRVVVPAREAVFWSVYPPPIVGHFGRGGFWEPTIVVHPAALREEPEVIAHELVHHFAWYWFPRQPRWFSEGLAQFVQTVGNEEPAEYRGAAGLLPRTLAAERGWVLRDVPQMPARSLLTGRDARYSSGTYVWSWLLYHWLWNQRPAQLSDFQRRLQRAEDPAAAWKAAFPDLDPDDRKAMKALDAALDANRQRGELVYYRVNAKADPTFTDAPLAPGEIHFLLLRGWATGSGGALLRSVLEDDPLNARALSLSPRPLAERLRALRESAKARPGDWRTWVLLGDALEGEGGGTEREAAYRRAVALEPRSALAQTRVAAHLARTGRAEEALPFAQDAVELAPTIPEVLEVAAGVAAHLGRCGEALALVRRAADLDPERKDASSGKHLLEIEERCRDGEPPRPPAVSPASPSPP